MIHKEILDASPPKFNIDDLVWFKSQLNNNLGVIVMGKIEAIRFIPGEFGFHYKNYHVTGSDDVISENDLSLYKRT